ncbi:MAG: acetyl-CoA carboxylase biotin carboxylase subunit, partial [Terriglobia bacterium]
EDPGNEFLPSPGIIERLRVPTGPGVRDDSGVFEGWSVPLEYDPLLSKLIIWGADRDEALARMARALDEYQISGIKTNIEFFRRLLDDPSVRAGEFDTGFIDRLPLEEMLAENGAETEYGRVAALAAAVEFMRRASPGGLTATSPKANGWKAAARRALLNQNPHAT